MHSHRRKRWILYASVRDVNTIYTFHMLYLCNNDKCNNFPHHKWHQIQMLLRPYQLVQRHAT